MHRKVLFRGVFVVKRLHNSTWGPVPLGDLIPKERSLAMSTADCIVWRLHGIVCTAHCAPCTVQWVHCSPCSVCTVHCSQCIMCTVHHAVCALLCTVGQPGVYRCHYIRAAALNWSRTGGRISQRVEWNDVEGRAKERIRGWGKIIVFQSIGPLGRCFL